LWAVLADMLGRGGIGHRRRGFLACPDHRVLVRARHSLLLAKVESNVQMVYRNASFQDLQHAAAEG